MAKRYVVTGAARGIGRAIALKLLGGGHEVAVLDTDESALAAWGRHSGSDRVVAMRCDVSSPSDVEAAFAQIGQRFEVLDGLVNNAGIADPRVPPLEQLSFEAWRRVLGTNLDGVFLCSKAAVARLRKAGGAIVNIASTRALQSEPNTEAYAASKGGAVALTHALAMSLGPSVRVNAVSPGWIDTSALQAGAERAEFSRADHEQHPVGRIGVPDDVAELVAYLLSDKAGFITGQNFVVDGGMTKKMIYVE